MLHRRQWLGWLTAAGIGTPTFQRALSQLASTQDKLTAEMIAQAQWISGTQLSAEEQEAIVGLVDNDRKQMQLVRAIEMGPDLPPALHFQTLAASGPSGESPPRRQARPTDVQALPRPTQADDLAFLPLTELSQLIQSRQITATELTQLYLERLKAYDPILKCVVNLTEELAMKQATAADRELSAHHYRGPLHGIPWGAKDLMAVCGYPTTWGIPDAREQKFDYNATVYERLVEAGAILVAKTSLGAIAMGDQWFGGMTRNPWNPKQGSSGSSAGSASATSAGLLGFAIGSETLGSIVTPSTRCGATGLRPTFGRVSRSGCMPLSWSMDKIGPIARSVEDCALIFDAIHGADGRDPTAIDRPFQWPIAIDWRSFRVGRVRRENESADEDVWQAIADLGCQVIDVTLPADYPLRAMTSAINVEGAASFDRPLKEGKTEGWNSWTQIFRAAQFLTAVDYIQLMRLRRKLMHDYEQAIQGIDVLVNGGDLIHTNLTGHPSVVFPFRLRNRNEVDQPQSVIITGHLFDESRLLAFGQALQQRAPAWLKRPPIITWLEKFNAGELEIK